MVVKCQVRGFRNPGLGQCSSSKYFRQNNICMSPVVGWQRQKLLKVYSKAAKFS
jgi:hypothetical protein